jgi:fatty acid desaturase
MQKLSSLLRHSEDKTQVFLAMIGPLALIVPFFLSFDIYFEILLWFAVWFFLCRHNYILHNHVHCPFTRSRNVNRILGAMLGFCTGMTVGIWKITHVHGHHVEHKVGHLPSRWFLRYFEVNETAPFSVFAAIVHSLKTAPIQLIVPLCILARRTITAGPIRRKFYRYYFLEFLLVYGLVGVFAWINPVKGFFYFGVIYALVYLVSRYVDYVTHASSGGESEYSIANVCIDPRFNRTFWNFGFHVAHHMQPSAHWTALPLIYEGLSISEDPASVAKRPNILGGFAPSTFSWHRVQSAGTTL